MTPQVIKDWMLVIMVAVVVALEMVILLVGTAVPESRLTANATLVNELRQNVKKCIHSTNCYCKQTTM